MRVALGLVCALAIAACHKDPPGPRAPTCQLNTNLGVDGPLKLRVDTIASGLEVPWSVVFLPNGDAWIAERPGRIRALRDGKLLPPIVTIPVSTQSEGGLLGLVLDPSFAQNRRFFVYFTGKKGDAIDTATFTPALLAQVVRSIAASDAPDEVVESLNPAEAAAVLARLSLEDQGRIAAVAMSLDRELTALP